MSKHNKIRAYYYDFRFPCRQKMLTPPLSVQKIFNRTVLGTGNEKIFYVRIFFLFKTKSENILKGEKYHEMVWELLTMES
jgi:hypothetical protein